MTFHSRLLHSVVSLVSPPVCAHAPSSFQTSPLPFSSQHLSVNTSSLTLPVNLHVFGLFVCIPRRESTAWIAFGIYTSFNTGMCILGALVAIQFTGVFTCCHALCLFHPGWTSVKRVTQVLKIYSNVMLPHSPLFVTLCLPTYVFKGLSLKSDPKSNAHSICNRLFIHVTVIQM